MMGMIGKYYPAPSGHMEKINDVKAGATSKSELYCA
jgi:hypothetical protein